MNAWRCRLYPPIIMLKDVKQQHVALAMFPKNIELYELKSFLHCLLLFRCSFQPTKRLLRFHRRSRPLSKSQHETDVFSLIPSVISLNILQRKDFFFLSVFPFPPLEPSPFYSDISTCCSLKAVVLLAPPSVSLHSLPYSPVLCVSSNLDLHFQRSVIMHSTDLPLFKYCEPFRTAVSY